MSEKALAAFKRDPRKFFEVDFPRMRRGTDAGFLHIEHLEHDPGEDDAS
jgi:hypothetical protein